MVGAMKSQVSEDGMSMSVTTDDGHEVISFHSQFKGEFETPMEKIEFNLKRINEGMIGVNSKHPVSVSYPYQTKKKVAHPKRSKYTRRKGKRKAKR